MKALIPVIIVAGFLAGCRASDPDSSAAVYDFSKVSTQVQTLVLKILKATI